MFIFVKILSWKSILFKSFFERRQGEKTNDLPSLIIEPTEVFPWLESESQEKDNEDEIDLAKKQKTPCERDFETKRHRRRVAREH